MTPPPPHGHAFEPVRFFAGWDQPLVDAMVAYLADGWNGEGVLDLSDRMVLVPTRQSGRRLREALAERAAVSESGVFPPRVLTPEAFVAEVRPEGRRVATAMESLMVWAAVLGGVRAEAFPSLFPQDPPRRDLSWALGVAEQWQEVRRTLGEGGLTMGEAARRLAAAGHPESARWADLARLESEYLRRLAEGGLEDATEARRQAASAPVWPEGVRRMDWLAVTDPLEVAVRAAADLGGRGLPVTVVVAAPAGRAGDFDAWGRPDPVVWSGMRDLMLPLERIHVAAGPAEQAAVVRGLVAGHADPAATLGLGVVDAEVAAFLAAGAGGAPTAALPSDLAVHRPEGLAAGDHEVWHVLDGLVGVMRERSFRALGRWLRFPAVAHMLRRRAGVGATLSQADLLKAWDAYGAAHLPQLLEDGVIFADEVVNPVVRAAESVVEAMAGRPLDGAVARLLSEVYAGRSFPQASPEGAVFRAMARELTGLLQQAAEAVSLAGLEPAPAEVLSLVLGQLRRVRLEVAERRPEAVDLNGWLELAWERAPHLVVAGVNDGLVPEVVAADGYLPESARVRLGLRRTDAARFARDAHQLQVLIRSRAAGGRVDVVLGRASAAGEPLRPSRLLFLRPDDELPERARILFGGGSPPEVRPLPAWRAAWRLRVPAPRRMERLSVTMLRAYLACPFRFYLRHGLGMESVDPEPRELDAAAFGRLCHAALKQLAAEPAMRREREAAVIEAFLVDRVRQTLRESHGTRLTVPLRVQLASAEKRLSSFAAWQAQSVRDGWETIHAELPLESLLGEPWKIGGVEIRGVIDRVDARGEERRILDYKTGDSPKRVAEAHLGKPLSEARLAAGWPAWQCWRDAKGKTGVWRDLQLPLYALAAREAWGCHPETGYFHLAKAPDQCDYEAWTGLTPERLEEAAACAEGAIAAIGRGEFWPPREGGRYDDFGWLLAGGDAAAVVDPSALTMP